MHAPQLPPPLLPLLDPLLEPLLLPLLLPVPVSSWPVPESYWKPPPLSFWKLPPLSWPDPPSRRVLRSGTDESPDEQATRSAPPTEVQTRSDRREASFMGWPQAPDVPSRRTGAEAYFPGKSRGWGLTRRVRTVRRGGKLYIRCTTWTGAPQGWQQKVVAPVPAASPVGAPPPATAHEPASVSVGAEASLTHSGPLYAAHTLGAGKEPPALPQPGVEKPFTSGDVQAAPLGVVHWQGEQPRRSSTPA